MLKLAVAGMWHLGAVTAACLASAGHRVVGIDEDPEVVRSLCRAKPLVAEPGLAEMIQRETQSGRLRFSSDFRVSSDAEVVWVAFDTPVDDYDQADLAFVHERALRLIETMSSGALLVMSSQMEVGSVARLEHESELLAAGRKLRFACAPENLRLGKAIEVFLNPDRVVLGVRDDISKEVLRSVYAPFTDRIEWMSVESAEMTKHAINSFLATSICFANEIATICEFSGANVQEVERGMKSDSRIGPGSYLHAGGAIAGGTLARDISFLRSLRDRYGVTSPLIEGTFASNENHKLWLQRHISSAVETLAGRTIAILGLTYKPGTDTLRRSSSLELARWLSSQGAMVQAFDPQITELPAGVENTLSISNNIADALCGADALIVMTACPEFQLVDPALVPPFVFDAARILEDALRERCDIQYYCVGGNIEANRQAGSSNRSESGIRAGYR